MAGGDDHRVKTAVGIGQGREYADPGIDADGQSQDIKTNTGEKKEVDGFGQAQGKHRAQDADADIRPRIHRYRIGRHTAEGAFRP